LDAFCKVVECKSFTRAAERMLLSQPTVSEHIRSLEGELGQKLLDRLSKEVVPTPVGKLFYGYASKILQTQQEAIQAVDEFIGVLTGRIVMGSGTIPGTYILPQLIARFRIMYPAIKATLKISSSRTIAQKVLEGELELGVVGAKWNEKGLEWREIFSDELCLAVHPAHHWASVGSVKLETLLGEPFIMREFGSGTREVIKKIFVEHGLKESDLEEVAEIGSTAAIKEAVKAGIGVSILSRCAVADDVACGRIKALDIGNHVMKRNFYLIHRRRRAISPVASFFYDYLCEHSK